MQWLTCFILALAVWLSFFLDYVDMGSTAATVVLLSPVFFVVAFGVISVAIILYRVATFNDCNEAAAELKQQIVFAKQDLQSKGFKF